MKTRTITGENYTGAWDKTRTACRAIVLRDGQILLSCGTRLDVWMIPGGGLEPHEEEKDCCIREVAEETGFLIQPSDCRLEIDEYYENWKWINKYFFGEVTGRTAVHLTAQEQAVGMVTRWLPVREAMAIFANHAAFAGTDEMRRGMYLREYTALCELLRERS